MFRPTCSPLETRNPIFLANLKILARFCRILSYGHTLKVTSPPILTKSFDTHTNTLTNYWWNRAFTKKGIFFTMERWKRAIPFLKELELEQVHFKNGKLTQILGVWVGAGEAPKVMEHVKPYIYIYILDAENNVV